MSYKKRNDFLLFFFQGTESVTKTEKKSRQPILSDSVSSTETDKSHGITQTPRSEATYFQPASSRGGLLFTTNVTVNQ